MALVWGTIRVLEDRGDPELHQGQAVVGVSLAEASTWGFGQIVPIVLLILPVLSFLGVLYGKFILSFYFFARAGCSDVGFLIK